MFRERQNLMGSGSCREGRGLSVHPIERSHKQDMQTIAMMQSVECHSSATTALVLLQERLSVKARLRVCLRGDTRARPEIFRSRTQYSGTGGDNERCIPSLCVLIIRF